MNIAWKHQQDKMPVAPWKMVATGIVLFDALCSIQFKTIHFCHRSTN